MSDTYQEAVELVEEIHDLIPDAEPDWFAIRTKAARLTEIADDRRGIPVPAVLGRQPLPPDYDSVGVRKAQAWLNEHLGEEVQASVQWVGTELSPLFARGTLELAAVEAREELENDQGRLTDEELAAVDELEDLYTVGRVLALNVDVLAKSATHVALPSPPDSDGPAIGFILEPGDRPGEPIVKIDIQLASSLEDAEDDS
jgi:hypothetical protein